MSKEMTVAEAVAYKEGLEVNIAELVHQFHEDTGLFVENMIFMARISEHKTQVQSMSGDGGEFVKKISDQPDISLVVSL